MTKSKKQKSEKQEIPELDFSALDFFDPLDAIDSSDYWLEPDILLSQLVGSMVNVGGMQMGITLFIKGAVMTGLLVGEREYLQAMTDLFTTQAKQAMSGLPEAAIQEAMSAFDFVDLAESPSHPPSSLGGGADDFEDDDDYIYVPPRYLHLKDPIIIRPESALTFMQSPIPIMRLRLSNIDGWMLGQAVPMDMDDMASDDAESVDELLH